MKLSIIIPSYNTKRLLERCLNSIKNNSVNESLEILVVDNASVDGSVEMVERKFPEVILLKNKQNLGYGKANNFAISKSKGEYVLLLNSDCIVQKGSIEELLTFIESRKHAFVGGKLLNEDLTPQPSCGPFYTLPIVFLMLFFKGDQLNITRYSPNTVTEVDWVSGACLLGRKEEFIASGLFDESIFMYMEEIDLLYRAKKKGYAVFFDPTAVFVHTGAASAGHKKEPVVNIYRGLDYFYKKHYSPYERAILTFLLRLKALLVIGFCEIMGKNDIKELYAKALHVLS